jgi:hypothetical protein
MQRFKATDRCLIESQGRILYGSAVALLDVSSCNDSNVRRYLSRARSQCVFNASAE